MQVNLSQLGRLLPAAHTAEPGYARSFVRWALIGLLLRLAIMPFTWSDDSVFIHAFASLLPEQAVLLVHSYMREHFGPVLDAQQWSYYPLGTYFTFGLWQLITRPLAPGFVEWMGGVREIYGQGGGYLPHYVWGAGDVPLFRALLVAKLPYLFADFGIALLLPRLVPDPRNALFAHRLWMLNPATLYATYAYGQFEILEALLMTAGLLLAQRGHPRWTVLLLGAAATYKHIPLLLVPPTALLLGRDWRQKLLLVLIGVAPYAGVRLVSLVFAPGVEGAIGNPNLALSYADLPASRLALLLRLALPLAYLLLLLLLVLRSTGLRPARLALGRSWLIVLLFLLVGLRPIGAYWYVLLTPLLAIECAHRRWLLKVTAAHALLLIPWTFSPGFNWGTLLAPLDPLFLPALPTPEALVSVVLEWGYIALASWYLFVALTLFLVAGLFLHLLGFSADERLQLPQWSRPLGRRVSALGLLGLGLFAAVRLFTAPPSQFDLLVNGVWQYAQPAGFLPLEPGRSLGQSFVSTLPNLTRIDLTLQLDGQGAVHDLALRLFLTGPYGPQIAEARPQESPLLLGIARFDFPPLPDSGGGLYYFEVTTGGLVPVGMGWTSNPYAHLPTRGQRFDDRVAVPGDLAFASFHAGASPGAAAATVQRRLAADPPFILPYLGLLAVLGFVWLRLAMSPARRRSEPPE